MTLIAEDMGVIFFLPDSFCSIDDLLLKFNRLIIMTDELPCSWKIKPASQQAVLLYFSFVEPITFVLQKCEP